MVGHSRPSLGRMVTTSSVSSLSNLSLSTYLVFLPSGDNSTLPTCQAHSSELHISFTIIFSPRSFLSPSAFTIAFDLIPGITSTGPWNAIYLFLSTFHLFLILSFENPSITAASSRGQPQLTRSGSHSGLFVHYTCIRPLATH